MWFILCGHFVNVCGQRVNVFINTDRLMWYFYLCLEDRVWDKKGRVIVDFTNHTYDLEMLFSFLSVSAFWWKCTTSQRRGGGKVVLGSSGWPGLKIPKRLVNFALFGPHRGTVIFLNSATLTESLRSYWSRYGLGRIAHKIICYYKTPLVFHKPWARSFM